MATTSPIRCPMMTAIYYRRSAMKLAIVFGHNARAQGAVRPDTAETEFAWNSLLACMIQ
jgi:hypothetical protein